MAMGAKVISVAATPTQPSVAAAPGLAQHLRDLWEAANDRWNQWVLNYTQGRQMDLLRRLGFRSPDWHDLAAVLGGLLAVAALGAAGWAAWQRRQPDPWLRLLDRFGRGRNRCDINFDGTA